MDEQKKVCEGHDCGNHCGHGGQKCPCPHHKVMPICIVIVGLLLIIGGFGWSSLDLTTWEIIIGALLVIKGGMKAMRGKCKCC